MRLSFSRKKLQLNFLKINKFGTVFAYIKAKGKNNI